MSLSVSSTQLHDAMETLQDRWEETCPLWRDIVRKDFDENYWAPLKPCMNMALRSIEQMTQVMARMRQDCE
jgi:hypothetical protein